ncbi:PepSY domain-containing protein [uncultured Lacinutrix sp.]|uniref:PepSY domain-containing protein n=1 Tax=uncultured Lacinutrix sp. TaxID=574032 RepID=UPI002611FB67|nr:PepSY domain-containing protein [uncultured Lacinutrix sp.]
MTISIWRYSHLVLAVSSSIFILIAALSGIILAFEPISNQLKPYAVKDANTLSLAKVIENLGKEHKEIITIEIDENNFVITDVLTNEGNNETFYVNPFNGKKIGGLIKKAPIFKFATNLHRSLFLKSTGRFIIGFVSFLLFLIVVTGILLIVKRQGGIKHFFSSIVKENFKQYWHIIIGRYAIIPIIIITLTGVFLSLEKFSLLPKNEISHKIEEQEPSISKLAAKDFQTFKTINLETIKKVEFPFSKDIEDYFTVKLKTQELLVNQYTGAVISRQDYPLISLISAWSLFLHTGQGTIIWAIVLLLVCFSIIFFMYSGFSMTIKRKEKNIVLKNKFSKDKAQYIILVGSETGSTFSFASLFYNALIAEGKAVFISDLNKYTTYKNATNFIVFTSTYGEGEAPVNAKKFEKLFQEIHQDKPITYSVVGFGSLMYPDFCKYAIVVDAMLQLHPKFIPNMALYKINNQSFNAFKNWSRQWSESTGLNINIKALELKTKHKKEKPFTVVSKTKINKDHSFLIRLKPNEKTTFESGDLLSIYPKNEAVERLYSIGKIDKDILLSIKKHEFGICSNYFNQLKNKDMVKAAIKRNHDFHFPKYSSQVLMIANGTGIAPFLGMINENPKKVKTHLFWGGRTRESLEMYSALIDEAFNKKTLSSFHIAYSQEKEEKIYVQDLLLEYTDLIINVLVNKGVIMICGSIAMQNVVLDIIENITKSKLNEPLSTFENNEQIKMDCY